MRAGHVHGWVCGQGEEDGFVAGADGAVVQARAAPWVGVFVGHCTEECV